MAVGDRLAGFNDVNLKEPGMKVMHGEFGKKLKVRSQNRNVYDFVFKFEIVLTEVVRGL